MGKNLNDKAISDAIIQYIKEEFGSMVEGLAGDDAIMTWIKPANEPNDEFSGSDSDSDVWDWSSSDEGESDDSDEDV